MKAKTSQTDDKAQVKRFRRAARELDCEDSEDRFNVALRTVGKPKPQRDAKKPRPAGDAGRG